MPLFEFVFVIQPIKKMPKLLANSFCVKLKWYEEKYNWQGKAFLAISREEQESLCLCWDMRES